MRPTIDATDPARPDQQPASASQAAASGLDSDSSALVGQGQERWIRGLPWLAALLCVVAASLADGLFFGDTVAFERDTTVFYFPLMEWVAQRLHQGELPLWTPQVFGGYPIFADGEIGLAYPPVVLALLLLPVDRAFILLRFVHLAIAGLGMFYLARSWRLPYASATVAGLVFALGNFLSAQIHHENIVRTASWLPVMLACVEYALRSTGNEWQPRVRWICLAAVALGLAGLGLHSQMLAVDVMILAGYAAFRWAVGPMWSLRRRPPWIDRLLVVVCVCAPVVVAGMGLAAVQIVPLVELASFSPRGIGIPYADSAAYSLTPYGLPQLVFPYLFRGPANLQWGLWTHWESYLYIGLAPLVLAIVALVKVRRREVLGWALMAAVGLVIALGQYSPINLHYLLWLVPGLSSLRAPGRFTVVVVLAGAMLAAYGLAWLQSVDLRAQLDRAGSSARLSPLLAGLAIAAGLLAVSVTGLHVIVLPTWPHEVRAAIDAVYLSLPRDSYRLTAADVVKGLMWSTDLANPRVLGALLGLAAVLAAGWLWQDGPLRLKWLRSWRGWPAVFVVLTAADLLLFAWDIHPREPLAKFAADPPSIRAVEQLPNKDGPPNRILAAQVLNQVAADRLAPFGIQDADGYSSLPFTWHRDYLGRVLYTDDALLDLWNVRYVLDPARYGKLSSYREVNFLQQQALLHSPSGSALSEQHFVLAGSSPIVELRFVSAMLDAVDVPQDAVVAQVELRDAAGQVVGTAELRAGRDTMEWASAVPSVQPYLKHQPVETAGVAYEGSTRPRERRLSFAAFTFDTPVPASEMVIRAVPPRGEFALFGAALVSADNSIQQLFGRTKTRYRQVYVDDEIRVWENTTALPRAFVVPRARVAPSVGAALGVMVHQPFEPRQEVILANDAAAQATRMRPPGDSDGSEGSATIVSYAPAAITMHTSTSSDAWLVLSDTYYPGWTASVDGQPASVLRGDVLFRVVQVPAGEHEVAMRFEPTSVRLGLATSVVTLLLLTGIFVSAGARATRRGGGRGVGRVGGRGARQSRTTSP